MVLAFFSKRLARGSGVRVLFGKILCNYVEATYFQNFPVCDHFYSIAGLLSRSVILSSIFRLIANLLSISSSCLYPFFLLKVGLTHFLLLFSFVRRHVHHYLLQNFHLAKGGSKNSYCNLLRYIRIVTF